MKTLFKLAAVALLACVSTVAALAAPPTALNISSEQGQPFSLVLDGRLLTRPLARQVHLDWLAPGRHWAEFSVPTGYGQPLRFRTSVWLEPGLATNYVLLVGPYGPQLRQVSAVAIGRPYGPGGYPGGAYPAQPGGGYYGGQNGAYPGSYGQVPAQPQGGYYDNSQQPVPPSRQGGYPNAGQYDTGAANQGAYPPNGGQYGNAAPNQPQPNYPAAPVPNNGTYPNQPQPSYPAAPMPAPDNGNYPSQQGQGQAYPAPAPAPGSYPSQQSQGYPAPDGSYAPGAPAAPSLSPLAPEEVTDLADSMRKQPSDDERVDMAKQTLEQGSLNSEGLVELLQTLTVEEARVDLAEFGYAHVADPQNFSRVYRVFQSNDSVQEVQRALGIQR